MMGMINTNELQTGRSEMMGAFQDMGEIAGEYNTMMERSSMGQMIRQMQAANEQDMPPSSDEEESEMIPYRPQAALKAATRGRNQGQRRRQMRGNDTGGAAGLEALFGGGNGMTGASGFEALLGGALGGGQGQGQGGGDDDEAPE